MKTNSTLLLLSLVFISTFSLLQANKNKLKLARSKVESTGVTAIEAPIEQAQSKTVKNDVILENTDKPKVENPKIESKKTEKKTAKNEKFIPSTSYVVKGKKYYTLSSKDAKDFTQIGLASWYGPGFHGKKTANGEIYNQNSLTGAHKTLPLSSKVKVTNIENNKSLIITINDRGPYHGNRILDLSKKAAEILGVLKKGTSKIKLEVL